jgi:hypothetical protein
MYDYAQTKTKNLYNKMTDVLSDVLLLQVTATERLFDKPNGFTPSHAETKRGSPCYRCGKHSGVSTRCSEQVRQRRSSASHLPVA